MNLLKAVYCNQYYELKPKGKGAAARTNGNRLLAVSLSLDLMLLVVILMILWPDFADAFANLIEDVFGRKQGRSLGKIVALIPFLIFLLLVRYTLGTEEKFAAIIRDFEALPVACQKQVSNRGLTFVIASMAGMFVSVCLALSFLA